MNQINDMKFETTQYRNTAVVKTLVEKLDASNAADLKAEFGVLNKNAVQSIVLDLSTTKYCDSTGLSAILMGNRLCKVANGQFILCGLSPMVLKMIQIAQLDKVFSIENSLEEAKARI